MKPKPFHLPIITLLLLAACKPTREQQIIGLWQQVSLQKPEMTDAMDQQMRFVDTVGRSTDSAANQSLYGTSNIDTFRKSIRRNIDSFKRAQGKAISETWFDFHKSGVVFLHSESGLDSARWSFKDDALMLEKKKLKGGSITIRREIQALNDTALELHYVENFLSSTESFKRVKR